MAEAAEGATIVIVKHGKPLAKLVGHTQRKEPRPPGCFKGEMLMAPDFDDEDPRINALFTGSGE